MKNKSRPFLRGVFVLILALLSSVSGPILIAGTAASGTEAYASGMHGPSEVVSIEVTQMGDPVCVTIQRGTFGEVADVYIWSARPESGYNNTGLYTGFVGSGEKRSLIRFGLDFLPEDAVVQSATFGIWEYTYGSGETVTAYRITESWSEGEPTWNSFASRYDTSVEWGSFVAGGPGFMTADVTGLVSAWVDGGVPNYGMLLRSSPGQAADFYMSSEVGNGGKRPWLEVCYVVGGGVGDSPIAVDDEATTDEDTPVVIDVLANDSDPDGTINPTTVSIASNPANGSLTVDPVSGDVTYTPNADYNGSDSFTYTVADDEGNTSNEATVSVTVNAVNDPPVAVDDFAATDEDIPVDIDVLANDTDVDGSIDPATVAIASGPSHGLVSVDPVSGDVTYSPDADYSGVDGFTYTVNDDEGDTSNEATVTVAIGNVYIPPVAVDDFAATDEETPVVIGVLTNDADLDGSIDPATVAIVSGPSHGLVSVDPVSGDVTYTPDADYSGVDSFSYTVNDDKGNTSNEATVTVAVGDVAVPPIAVDDEATTDEDTAVVIDVLANDSDPDGAINPTTVSIASDPANGSVTVDPVSGDVTYTPNADYNGSDSFSYTVNDDEGNTSNEATVSVTVNAVNDPPVAVDDLATTEEGIPVDIDVLTNDSDPDGDTISVSAYDAASAEGGTVSCTSAVCTYNPPAGFEGTDSFNYTASDGNGGSDTATVTVTVTAPGPAPLPHKVYLPIILYKVTPGANDPPVAVDDLATTDEDTAVDVEVLINDYDRDGDTIVVSANDAASVEGGTVSCTSAVCTYNPPTDFNGSDSFNYAASDGNGGTDTATVTVIVNPVNDPPVAEDDAANTEEDTPVDIDVLANDSDPDGDTITISAYDAASAEGGTVSCTSAVCTYDPPAGFEGTDSFNYTASDGNGGTDTATVTVVVGAPEPAALPNALYLPVVMYTLTAPDLVVERINVTSNRVEVTLKNRGTAAVLPAHAFRVDLYVDPHPAPTEINQTWSTLCSQGIAWVVTGPALPLEQGEEVVLTLGDAYYQPSLSNFPGSLPPGTPIYAQVDSFSADTNYGAVLEFHENPPIIYNNIMGPVISIR